jgi:hypothetical protein
MHVARALRSWVGAALLALAGPLLPVALVAQDATWLPNPGSQDFNTDSNWSTGTVPSGATAFFSISAVTNLKTSLDTSVLGLTLNAGASTTGSPTRISSRSQGQASSSMAAACG